MVKRRFQVDLLSYGAGLVAIFLVLAIKYDVRVATLAIGCFVVGFLNVFGAARALLMFARRQHVSRISMALAACALAGTAALVATGHWLPLLLVTACLLLIDAVSLRFK
jgi:hypothetical protein